MIKKHIDQVTPGMILAKTIYGDNYEVLLKKGVELTQDYIMRLKAKGYLRIYIDTKETEDIVLKDPVSDKIRLMSTKNVLTVYNVTLSALADIEAQTNEAVFKCINTKIKKTFQESHALRQLVNDINTFLDEILNQEVLSGLNSIKTTDNYTFEHSIDSAIISLFIAKKLLLEKKKLKQLAVGGFLHDIGKIFIDEKILNKPEKLTPEEYNHIKLHTSYGYELLKDIETIGTLSAHISYQHHERQDGKGYPRGLVGSNKLDMDDIAYVEQDKLVLHAEIAAVADFYDACISDRPYRPALPADRVYEFVREGAGSQFNRELVDYFLNVIPKYPLGSEIIINNGLYKDFTGYVLSLNLQQLSRPKIILLYDNKKNKIKPVEIDLSSNSSLDIKCI